jgi:hypothetical protein
MTPLTADLVAIPTAPPSIVRAAIAIVVQRLGALTPCPAVTKLQATADAQLREVDAWMVSTLAIEERDRFMTRVLDLHIAVVKLERGGSAT